MLTSSGQRVNCLSQPVLFILRPVTARYTCVSNNCAIINWKKKGGQLLRRRLPSPHYFVFVFLLWNNLYNIIIRSTERAGIGRQYGPLLKSTYAGEVGESHYWVIDSLLCMFICIPFFRLGGWPFIRLFIAT